VIFGQAEIRAPTSWTQPSLEVHLCPQPYNPVSRVRTEEAAWLGAGGNDPEVIVAAGIAQLAAAPNWTRGASNFSCVLNDD
jgi:hypothetical protein